VNETVEKPRAEAAHIPPPPGRPETDADARADRMDREGQDERRPDARGGSPDADRQSRESDGDDRKDGGKDGKKKSRWPLIILALVVVVAIIGGTIYWFMTRDYETTDDAYTDGNSIVIAPKVAGYVTELDVNDNTIVKAGQVLFRIDPRDYIAARDQAQASLSLARSQLASAEVNLEEAQVRAPANLAQAEAQLAQARANQSQAEQNYRRQRAVDPRATTQTNVDQATAQLKSDTAAVASAQANMQVAGLVRQTIQTAEDQVKQAQAQVEQAAANLAQAEVNLSYTTVIAPQDGRVTKRTVDRGTFVQAGQQSFYIVAPKVWVTANFKENQLADMQPGQPVSLSIDAYPSLDMHGHIDSIQQGSGAQFSAFPAENATGNYVKIVRRVPVKIDIDSGLPDGRTLPLGLSVEAAVKVR
jgi:membrane fusion protein (multidrug efflux system)